MATPKRASSSLQHPGRALDPHAPAPDVRTPTLAHARSTTTLAFASTLASALAALTLAAPACGNNDPSNPDPTPGFGNGSARIDWRLVQAGSGDPLTCQPLGLDEAVLSVGRETIVVPCGDPQTATFAELTPGRYPVIIELRTADGRTAHERRDNLLIEPQKETALELVFELDTTSATTGALLVQWQILGFGSDPASGCASINATTTRVTELPGSIAPARATAPCDAGQVTLPNLRPGAYGLLVELLGPDNTQVAANSIPTVVVAAGATATPDPVPFGSETPRFARFFATWTVNGTTPASGCLDANADAVLVRAFADGAMIPTFTASAACALGQLRVEEIAPSLRNQRVVLQLYRGLLSDPPLPVVLTSTTVRNVRFRPLETSTVTAALDAR